MTNKQIAENFIKNYGKDKMNFLQRKQLQTEIDAHNAAVKKIKAEKKSKKSNQLK